MNVIEPINVTASVLTSSTVPELDTTHDPLEWNSATAYVVGDLVSVAADHLVYQALTAGTNISPTSNVAAGNGVTGTHWNVVYPTNRYRMFDTVNGTETIATSPLVVRITPNQLFTTVSCFNLTASNVNIRVVDPIDGEVYNEDISMLDDSEITDWFQFYYAEISNATEFVAVDLPAYTSAYVEVTITNDSSDVRVGNFIIGPNSELGTLEYGSSIDLLDFSRKETDDFGNFTVVPRRNSKLVNFQGFTEAARTSFLFRKLSSLTNIPCVWYGVGGSANVDPTVVYGYYRDSNISMDNPTTTPFNIQIEGLT